MLRTVFYLLVVFLLMPVPSSLLETEYHGTCQDLCGELKQLRERVHQQAAALSEIKKKLVYLENESAGEMKNIPLPSITVSITVAVYTVPALLKNLIWYVEIEKI